jgi:uncharacterized protein (TIGR00251 family)
MRWDGADLLLDVRVLPRASRDEVVGMQGGRLKIKITAPPVDGKANQHLISYLAKLCGVPKSDVTLIKGETGREKSFRIRSPRLVPDEFQAN